MKKQLRDITIIFGITIILLEIAMRILGYQAYYFPPFSITSEPSGSLIPHDGMGLALQPGQFKVTMNDSLEYQTYRFSDSTRYLGDSDALHWIEFHGCSFTYGMGVNTENAFGYLLQKKLASTSKIINKAVPGYGNLQGLLSLKNRLKEGNIRLPDTIIMFYASFHDERNALSPYYREHMYYGFLNMNKDVKQQFKDKVSRFPFASIDRQGQLNIQHDNMNTIFRPVPLREYSAIANAIQNSINLKKHQNTPANDISKAILLEMDKTCKEQKIEFVVASIVKDSITQHTLKDLRAKGVETLDMGLDILGDTTYNNHPYDSHPNPMAHRIYADRLYHYLDFEPIH